MNIRLSKSTFIKGLQCQKALYLLKYHPELRDAISASQQAIFDQGADVGMLAQQLYPGGINPSTSLPLDYDKCIADTQKLVINETPVIYEAGFHHDDVHCFMDILVKGKEGWKAFEVKSSTHVHPVNYWDAALQYWVMSGTGMEIEQISIVHINNQYERIGDLDIKELFVEVDISDKVKAMQKDISAKLISLKSMLKSRKMPGVDIGPHCFDPYSCDFQGECWKHIPENSVFNIAGLRGPKKWELYEKGIIKFDDIPEGAPLDWKEWQQVKAELRQETYIDKTAIRAFISKLEYPLYYLDFESFTSAVPVFEHTRPYQQVVFQYSLHIQDQKAGPLQHKEFLAETTVDPRIPFIEQLIKDLGETGDILVYNQAFEKTRLHEIANTFPQYSKEIHKIINRIVDLMYPFKARKYYDPKQRGSYSIKHVLPALAPGFTYEGMAIADGITAGNSFRQLYRETHPANIDRIRAELLEYCKMDTLAMVKVMEVLERV